jgi:signal transduction histidine kinase
VGSNDHTFDIVGPSSGLDWVRSIQTVKNLPGLQVTSLFEDHAGRHWVGIDNTLNIYENGRLTKILGRNGGPTGMILGITEDKDNNLWMLSYKPPRLLLRVSDRRVQEEVPMPPMPEGRALVADSRGGIWLGLTNGDLARYQDGHAETFHFEHPPSSLVYQVALSSDGSVLGATSYGLIGWSNGKQRTLGARNGFPCDSVNSFVEDNRGDLWVYTRCGLVQIEKSDLQRWWADPNVKLQPRVFDVFDGLRAGIPTPFERSALRDRDGRLWFANASVVQMVDPAHMVRTLTPPVHLEQIIADHKVYLPAGNIRLPARTRDVEIDYTALSFRVPQKVRFRYRLEGRDPDWQEAGNRRQAFYTDLGPRAYRFRVIAANDCGVWNETGDSLEFSLAPAYYQTTWFRAGCVVAFFATLWGLYRLRLYQLSREFDAQLDGRVEERTRVGRELHDTMLQSFQASLFQMQAARNLFSRRSEHALQNLDHAITMAAGAIAEGRNAVGDLRSAAIRNDLAGALQAVGGELAADGAAKFDLVVEGPPRDLRPIVGDEMYRIGAEALRNAFRHARAHHIETDIRYSAQLVRLQIRDDGAGIAPEILERGRSDHYGLAGMRERAQKIGAKLEIWSGPGKGTEINLSIPASLAYRASYRNRWRLFKRQ